MLKNDLIVQLRKIYVLAYLMYDFFGTLGHCTVMQADTTCWLSY